MLLENLETLARAASEGAGQTVFVTGEAGAGKTTLLRAFEARMSGARLLRGACEDLSIPEALGPLRDIAGDAGVDLDALFRDERDRLDVFGRLLFAIEAPDQTALLLIEDLHWADEATLDFLRFAARRLRGRRILLVVSSRDDETEGRPQIRRALGGVPPFDVTRIALQPLSTEAVARMAAGTRQDADELYRITGGNAFYVSELLKVGVGEGLRSLQDTILHRIGRLHPDVQTVIEAVSVFPRRAERAWALDVAGSGDEDVIDMAADTGLIEDRDGYLAFRHEIARQVVENTLRSGRRRRLNKALLAVMQTAGTVPNARLLHHARAADDLTETARLAPVAGREALAAGANRQAADYLAIAVDLADPQDTGPFAALLFDAGEACRLANRMLDAVGFFERALSVTEGNPVLRARTLQRLSRVKWIAGKKVQARTLGDEAIALLEPEGSGELAMALAHRAQVAMSDFAVQESLPLARRAEDMARRLGRIDIVSHALSTQSLVSLFDSSEINALYAESITAAKAARSPVNLVRCLANSGIVNWCGLRFPEALSLLDTAIETAFETDTTEQVNFHQGFRVHVLDRMGQWDDALAKAQDILSRPLEEASPKIMLRLTVSRIAMRRGEDDAAQHLDEILTWLGDEEDARHICDVACLFVERAWLGFDDGVPAQALMDHARAIAINPMLKEDLLDWQRRLDPSRLPDNIHGLHAPYNAAMAGDRRKAAAEWHRIGDPYREALSLGEGESDAVAQAVAILNRLGATRVRDHVIQRAQERGLSVAATTGPRATTLANPAGLTRRQMEVLALLDEGLSNAAIGERLFVSPKTVDHHVSAILGKLDVSSRGEAAAAARQARLLGKK